MSGAQTDVWAAFNPEPPPAADPWADYTPQPAGEHIRQGIGAAAARAGGFADNLVRQAARGVTLGYADEIAAAGRAGVGSLTGEPGSIGERYGAALTEERARDRDFEAQHPIAAGVAQFAGGVALPLRIAGGAASLPGAMVRGGLTGAAMGGAAGFGEGEGGFAPRAASGALGAAMGGTVGAVIPPAVSGAAALGGTVGRRLGFGSPAAPAERMILRDLQRDGMTPQDLVASAGRTDKPEILADLGGENLTSTAQTIARLPGTARDAAGRVVEMRGGARQGERLADDVRAALSGDDFRTEVNALMAQRRETATPLYEQAYAVELPRDLRLQRFLNDPDVAKGVEAGAASARREALAADRAFDPADLGVRFEPDGSIQLTGEGMPTRLFDAAKRGLDEMEQVARGPNGQATSRSREIAQLRTSMLAEVDRLNPAFAEARAAYAGPSLLMDSMRLGRRLLSDGPDAAEFTAAEIAKLSPSEREFFRVGVARGLMDRIEGAVDNAEQTRINRIFATPAVRNRLRAAFDSDAAYEQFADRMQRETRMAATNRMINPRAGSATMPLAEKRADLERPPPGPVSGAIVDPERQAAAGGSLMPDLLRAGTGGGLTSPAFRIMERMGQSSRARGLEQNSGILGDYLFNPDPAARQAMARSLVNRATRDQAVGQAARPLIGGALRGGAALGGLLSDGF